MAVPQAKVWAVASGSSGPRAPAGPPPGAEAELKRKRDEADAALLKASKTKKGKFMWTQCDSITVAVNGDADISQSEEAQRVYGLIPGRYWKIGSFGGRPVWRQEPNPNEANSLELFYFYSPEGWHIASSMQPGDDEKMAWGKTRKDEGMLTQLHVPWWSKHVDFNITVLPTEKYADEQVTSLMKDCHLLQSEVIQYRDGYESIGVKMDTPGPPSLPLEFYDESEGKGKGKGVGHDEEHDEEPPAKGKGKGPDKGKGKGKTGWLNKCSKLVELVLQGNFDDAMEMSKRYGSQDSMYPLLSAGSQNDVDAFMGWNTPEPWFAFNANSELFLRTLAEYALEFSSHLKVDV